MIKNISSVCNRNRNKIYVCYSFCIHLGLRLSPRVLLRPSWKSIFITTFKVKAGWFFNIRALHQVCIQNLLCGDVEGALTTRTQWHVSTLKACLAQKTVHTHFHRSKSKSTWMELGREDAGHWLLLLAKVEGVSPPPWPSLRCLLGHTLVESVTE